MRRGSSWSSCEENFGTPSGCEWANRMDCPNSLVHDDKRILLLGICYYIGHPSAVRAEVETTFSEGIIVFALLPIHDRDHFTFVSGLIS